MRTYTITLHKGQNSLTIIQEYLYDTIRSNIEIHGNPNLFDNAQFPVPAEKLEQAVAYFCKRRPGTTYTLTHDGGDCPTLIC
ncbi:MAG: hypothetical protein H7A51_02620 [Akkermansiaceae bacterium]|nr:hypothetical protein [Akkermansiaceae bacterium]